MKNALHLEVLPQSPVLPLALTRENVLSNILVTGIGTVA
jgi:hypothetical protein